jgi:hypothetical protein
MHRKFKVLLIDDTEAVLIRLKSILTQDIAKDGLFIKISVETLKVGFTENNGNFTISDETINNLGILCETKFDYIFSDFGFIGNKQASDDLKEKLLKENRGVRTDDIQGLVFQLKDLKTKFEEMCRGENALADELQNRIKANFLDHKNPVRMYTYSPWPYSNYFNGNEKLIRENEVKYIFPYVGDYRQILMHEEFDIKPNLEDAFEPKEDFKAFLTNLLSKKLNSLIQYSALENMIVSQSKLRINKTDTSFKALTLWAIGFGAAVAVFSEVLTHFARETISLTLEHLGFTFDKNLLLNLIVTIVLTLLIYFGFSKLGVKFAVKTEKLIEKIVQD